MLDMLGWERDFHLRVVICSLGTCFCPHQQKEAGTQSWEVREGRCLGTSKPIQNHKHLEASLYFTLISLSSCRFEQFSMCWALKTRQDPPTEDLSEETDVNQVGFVITHSQFCGERADTMVLNSRKSCRAMSKHLSNQATIARASGAGVLVSQRVSGDRLVSQKGLLLICYSLSQSGASNLSLNSHLDAFFFFNTLMKLSGA